MINALILLVKTIVTTLGHTYSFSFWRNFPMKVKYWFLLVSKGHFSIEKKENNGSIAIQTIFFLFGDINVKIRQDVVTRGNKDLVALHIREMQKFKEEVLLFIPVVISGILNAGGILYSVLQLLRQLNVIN
jgi:hypothetical protein